MTSSRRLFQLSHTKLAKIKVLGSQTKRPLKPYKTRAYSRHFTGVNILKMLCHHIPGLTVTSSCHCLENLYQNKVRKISLLECEIRWDAKHASSGRLLSCGGNKPFHPNCPSIWIRASMNIAWNIALNKNRNPMSTHDSNCTEPQYVR